MKKWVFIKNAAILTVTALLLRFAGMILRIYISNQIGPEGMGLYQLILTIYTLATTLATTGIATAVTRLIADESGRLSGKGLLHILKRCLLLSALIGLTAAAALFAFAFPIARDLLKDERAADALRILTPGLPCMAVAACLRGYFIARRKTGWPSWAQITEQVVRIGLVMMLLQYTLPLGIGAACCAVMAANMVSEIVCCLMLALACRRDVRRLNTPSGLPSHPRYGVVRKILGIAVPISAGRSLNSALRTAENLIVPGALERFTLSRSTALAQFGALKGMALPVLFFPSSFLTALSTLLIPEISNAYATANTPLIHRAVHRTIQITLGLSFLIAGLFFLYADELGMLLYQSEEVGMMLRFLAPIVPLMYLESMIDGILKGLNQQVAGLIYSVSDSVLRICLILWMLPLWGIRGFLVLMIFSNVMTCGLNLRRLIRVTEIRIRWRQWLLVPGGALCVTLCTLYVLSGSLRALFPSYWAMGIGMVLGIVIYTSVWFLSGGIPKEDLSKILTPGFSKAGRKASQTGI